MTLTYKQGPILRERSVASCPKDFPCFKSESGGPLEGPAMNENRGGEMGVGRGGGTQEN